MIPNDVVERVRAEADIIAVIGEYVKLKRVGNSFRGPCPFHHGKHDNFSVTSRGGYKCFVCGESGDVFTFVEKHLGLDFVEAVKLVGAKTGIDVHEVAQRTDERDPREPFWELNAAAAELFRAQLWDAPAGAAAREYLASRGLSRDDADRFSLGYAPRDPGAMREALATLGFDETRQQGAGLLVAREDGAVRPRFRDRLMFPIHDAQGRVVGFGGRVLGAGEPKYLNSAESEVFAKRQLLYGLHLAKHAIRRAERLIIVEGYFDAIRLVLAGVAEVVAPLGTALTEQQAALVRKYTKTVFLLYDSDQAGLKATFRSGDVLLAQGVAVRVITLPDGDDPDTFVAAHGADGFERAAATSVDVFDRKIQILERGGWFADLRRKRQAIDKLLPTIRAAADPVTRDLYLARTGDVAGVSRDMLARELAQRPRERGISATAGGEARLEDGAPDPAPSVSARRAERRADHRARGAQAERELVRLLLHARRYVEPVAERIGPPGFRDPAYRAIFSELVSAPEAGVDEIAAALDDDVVGELQALLEESGGLELVDTVLDASVNALLSREIDEELREIDGLLPLADSERQDELIQRKRQLAAELQALGRPRWKGFNSSRR